MSGAGQPLPTAVPLFEGATRLPAHPRRAFVEQVMGLPVSVHVRGPRAEGTWVSDAVDRFLAALRRDDELFSSWKATSEVSAVRRGDLGLDDASPRVREAARLCATATRRTGGAFSAWLPDENGCPRFDPTGLVKGWAVEQAFDVLCTDLNGGIPHDVLVNAGGDVAVRCARTDTPGWRVTVEDPRDRSRTLVTIPLRRGAVATSGTAARGEHLVDPVSGTPARDLLSATVIGPSLTWADVYSTAAFVLGRNAAAWLRTVDDHAGVLARRDGRVEIVRPNR